MKTVGILTGGGDAPGLNAVIRAIVRRSLPRGYRIVGIRHGWRGMLDKDDRRRSMRRPTSGILHRGGTILGTSRTNPYKTAEDAEPARGQLQGVGARRAGRHRRRGHAGRRGEARHAAGSRSSAFRRRSTTTSPVPTRRSGSTRRSPSPPRRSIASIRPPSLTIASSSARSWARHAGWIALHSGMAGGADFILLPERPVDDRRRLRRGHAPPERGTHVLDHRRGRRGAMLGDRRDRKAPSSTPSATSSSAASESALAHEIEAAHGMRDALGSAGPRAARRHADRVRPLARLALRAARGRHGPRRIVRDDGRVSREAFHAGAVGRGGRRAQDGSRGSHRPRVRPLRVKGA